MHACMSFDITFKLLTLVLSMEFWLIGLSLIGCLHERLEFGCPVVACLPFSNKNIIANILHWRFVITPLSLGFQEIPIQYPSVSPRETRNQEVNLSVDIDFAVFANRNHRLPSCRQPLP